MHRYFVVNKPYHMVSQFVSSHKVRLLGDLNIDFPEGTHAIGRLDNHSEGLLLLTTDKSVTKLLFESQTPHKRTYLVKVRRPLSPEALLQLQSGVTIIIKGGVSYTTPPCDVQIVTPPNRFICRRFSAA
jgi:23S rRNA pseudouridine2457 synthase